VRRQVRGEDSPSHGIRNWNRKPGVWAAHDSSEVSQDIRLSAYFPDNGNGRQACTVVEQVKAEPSGATGSVRNPPRAQISSVWLRQGSEASSISNPSRETFHLVVQVTS